MAIVKCYIFTYYILQQYKFDRSFSDVSHISNTSYTFLQHDTNSIANRYSITASSIKFFVEIITSSDTLRTLEKKGKEKAEMKRRTVGENVQRILRSSIERQEKKVRLAGYGEIILGDKRKNGEGGGEGKGDGADRRKIERKGKHEKLGYSSECR